MRDLRLSFTDAWEEEVGGIIADSLCNGCFAIAKETGEAKYIFSFEGENVLQSGLYYRIYPYGRELFFVPGYAKSIRAWNQDTRQQTAYPIMGKSDSSYRYVDSCRIGDVIWLLPASLSQPLVSFDLERHTVEFWNDYMNGQPEEIKSKTGEVFFRQYAVTGTRAYTVLRDSPYLVCFDLKEKQFSVKRISGKEYAFNDVGYGMNSFWLAQKGSAEILRWQPDTGETEIYRPPVMEDGPSAGYSNIIEHQGRIFLIPNIGTKILEANPAKKELEVFCELPKDLGRMQDERSGWRRFYFYRNIGDQIRLYPNQADSVVDIHVAEQYAVCQSYQISEEWYREVFQKQLMPAYFADTFSKKGAELQETKRVDLDAFASYVEQRQSDERTEEELNYGKKIHQTLICN